MTFEGTIDSNLVLLAKIEKIVEECVQCLDQDKVRIIGFVLKDDVCTWQIGE